MNFHKTGMYFVNVICSILGTSLLFTSFILDRKIHNVSLIVHETPIKITALILYILGCAYLFLVFSVGCIGTTSENGGLLFTYSFSILFLVLIQVSLACFAVFHIDSMTASSVLELKQRFAKSYNHSDIDIGMTEMKLSCCGLFGPDDYYLKSIPYTCCDRDADHCDWNNASKLGCIRAIVLYLNEITEIATVVCLVDGILFIVAALYIGFFAEKVKLQERDMQGPRQRLNPV